MSDREARAVAVVGLGALLPDAPDAASFWKNVCERRYSITDVPPDRWNVDEYYDPDPSALEKTYSKIGAWVRGYSFDWHRYKVPPKVAAAMDPGQQWAVTIAAQALTDFGYPERKLDLERTGVVLGAAMGGELHYMTNLRVAFPEFRRALEGVDAFSHLPSDVRREIVARWQEEVRKKLPPITEDSMPGELPNIISGRVANILNLRGPSFITDAACASSLAAVDAATDLLVDGHCDAIITGGVDRNMGASTFVKFCKIGALSATGTRPFGDGADGFVMGEGAAAFLLKRLADAERDGDKIYAVIRGVGASSDGKGKAITAPNPLGQKLAVKRAWEHAGLDPATAGMVEAHGTSTKVGDVVEVESLGECFASAGRGKIALGSVKSNIGHLKAGAGAAGLLKTVLSLHHELLPPTLNSERPNPGIDFSASPFTLNHELREWKRTNGTPRRAGVSAYGFGGTNFHVAVEEHVPGLLTRTKETITVPAAMPVASRGIATASPAGATPKAPFRGILALGAASAEQLRTRLDGELARAKAGTVPPIAPPSAADLGARERIVLDFESGPDLVDKLQRAKRALETDAPMAWKALTNQGVFRGSGAPAGKVAFLFPGQGSQFVNMGRALYDREPVVRAVFDEADAVLAPILGRPLTSFLFADPSDAAATARAEEELRQTAITQPAVLTVDNALRALLAEYGMRPDYVMGHSLGEYGALVAAEAMPFADALEASAARGREMTRVSLADNGWMAAVMGPLEIVQKTLASIDGYVVTANINSQNQAVIGGETEAVKRAMEALAAQGIETVRLPVSHAFHTRIVAPAAEPLGRVLDRLRISSPKLPVVTNVTGELYPTSRQEVRDTLVSQIASPVQWVRGLETLWREGVRTFVEVGPKKVLKGLVDDVLGKREGLASLFTNHPKLGELASFNQALCGLYAAGCGVPATIEQPAAAAITAAPNDGTPETDVSTKSLEELAQVLARTFAGMSSAATRGSADGVYDRNAAPAGSVVISGCGLGLPGERPVMDPENVDRILRGEQLIDLVPARFRELMAKKNVTRVVKTAEGDGRFETITDSADVIKLAARPGPFDLAAEYGVPAKLVEALDTTTQLAIAVGIDALREAGIPLVQTWRRTSKGTFLPDRWMLPESMREETGVIFCSAFPGLDRFADELRRYYEYDSRRTRREALDEVRRQTDDPYALREVSRQIAQLDEELTREPYAFDRRFLLRVLPMGHSQFAEYIGAHGPNALANAACASTAHSVAMAEDWIRTGRCRRVVVIAADNVTSDSLMEWMGAGFLAAGAAATDDKVEDAALPFDRRRHGMIVGMGAAALVVESQDAVEERGMRGIVELLSSETRNSAFHATRLDVDHVSSVVESLVRSAERRFGIDRRAMAPETVFVSHETYTPARGGSASAEVAALRRVFGGAANDVVISNTKGLSGHTMGAGVEDVLAVKMLERGIVPPIANFKEPDPELGILNLSRGGRYPVNYAIHLAAGFGSQIALTLTRRIAGGAERVERPDVHRRWLDAVTGIDNAAIEVVNRTLRVASSGAPSRAPQPASWQWGTGPTRRAPAPSPFAYPAVAAPVPAFVTAQPAPTARPVLDAAPRATAPAPAAVAAPAPKGVPAPAQSAPPPAAASRPPTAPPEPAAPAPAVAAATTAAPAPASVADPVVERVVAIVSQKTGYPPDLLDMDLDLEADLGVDTVKQAETFAAVREEWSIARVENLRLRDFPTLRHVVGFVRQHRPDLAPPAAAPAQAASAPVASTPMPAAAQVAAPAAASSAAPAPAPLATVADPVVARVVAIVSDKTGYPPDLLDMDLDLEADLGVDTVKQAETFAAVREEWSIPRVENLRLRDFPTLRHVVGFVRQHRPDLAVPAAAPAIPHAQPAPEAPPAAIAAPSATAPATTATAAAPEPYPLTSADQAPRRVATPVLRPPLDLCKPTGVKLGAGVRVVVARRAAESVLAQKLADLGATVLELDPRQPPEELEKALRAWLADGPIHGIFWMPSVDPESRLDDMSLEVFRERTRVVVKNLASTMRVLYESIGAPGTFLVAATRLGGLFGLGDEGTDAPIGGAVQGFVKAYKRERRDALVKVVDFATDATDAEIADALVDEALTDPGVVEIGRRSGLRWSIGLDVRPVTPSEAVHLDGRSVFVVTGAAGGITSAIVADLAAATKGTFHLLDLVAPPAADDPHVALFRQGRERLKEALIAESKARGEKPTPVAIDRQLMAIERQEAALRALTSVQAAGGTAHWHAVNLLDDASVRAAVDEIRRVSGRIDALVHAGGIEISRALPDKPDDEFARVFDIKANGFFSLLRAAHDMPLGATVVFSSVAGRFGNSGQTDYSAANALLCAMSRGLRRS
ncbi:MAG TPA: SDR family NAD(P)-dependent oxidoreductase, partial [Anaeromyxobacteraceae bacterium]|nr:SDR family NAD(P)-dependent oxidoreductase [Anaeromyxobacteraceae bacterium]